MAKATTAQRLLDVAGRVMGADAPLRIQAWDGSVAGPAEATTVIFRSRRGLRRLMWSPNEMGLAEAYISGDIDLDGELGEGLSTMWAAVRAGEMSKPKLGVKQAVGLAGSAVRLGIIGRRPPKPEQAAQLSGEQHSRDRDRAAIAHHYDLSNAFYSLLLDESMAYSCGYYVDGPGTDLVVAQRAKLDLVCRKLGLAKGSKHLDIGCGWGSLIIHAAKHFGTQSTGVTLSRQQFDFVSQRIIDEGVEGQVTVRLADYRELSVDSSSGARMFEPGTFDAVSTIEMGEHVGDAEYPAFASILFDMLRPGGRALVQQMSRGENAPGGGAFIEKFIAPDMHMKPLGMTVNLLNNSGLEVRDVQALREHYTWTIRAWLERFEARLPEVDEMLGEVGTRVWRLYLVGSALAFEENRMGVDQMLCQKPLVNGVSAMEPTEKAWAL
ncbi:class I SAM-dependent methyltransferase [Nakamurella antarctica]|uniref:Class I SAM-dependent methyltransferase n=1 Tax=Nakamurella antarctica TaxID=1902245 RepID=A0A3G8ZZC5_9ACTN|nr:cyclopropane-fatty-acyl-phospholipid synthase family protein [Nakamurella antarctica]AZI58901.1 class I SAM-dependent methyltransferase [Nakamurella antarctica]